MIYSHKPKVDRTEWHEFFAWWPRTVCFTRTGRTATVWLDNLERRRIIDPHPNWAGDDSHWEYRLLPKHY